MDLFTFDTVGEQTLLDSDQYQNADVLYECNELKNSESANNEEETNSNDEHEPEYDYGGKKHICRFEENKKY